MKPSPRLAEQLRYLADIGWEDLYRARVAGPVATAEPRAAIDPTRSSETPPADRVGGSLEEIALVARECRRCRLCETRNLVVFGAGDPRARLMFVGEGPGAEEDKQGLPFVGRAGELLTKMIRAIDLEREQVYIANVVKCRPPGNREPEPDEVAACRSYLEAQIDAIRPTVLVCLGRVAAQCLLGTDSTLGKMRGQWFDVRGVATRVTYHPAALLRNPGFKRPTWEDLQVVRDRLNEAADQG